MLVSVITPNYNCAPYIAQTIESVLSQTFPDWEMLIADDCSTDGSTQIAAAYAKKDRRIRLYSTLSHSGSPLEPRNLALRNARGRYIAFLDSDDLWLPHKLEHQIPLLEDTQTAIVFSDYEKVAEDGRRNTRIIRAPAAVTYRDLLKSNYIGNLTAVCDTGKTGPLLFEHPGHEDYALWLDILQRGFIARSTGTVEALYRVRPCSTSSRKSAAVTWQWDIYRRRLNLSFPYSACLLCRYMTNGVLKYLT
jgi:glycosyltransferase involved in cell wall biosynthesis